MINKITNELEQAAQIINTGGLVAFPTETVYGLGADALNPLAVAKIFAAKNRPTFDPLIVHIANTGWLNKLCQTLPPKAEILIKKFWPGPLTLVLPKKKIVPDLVTAGLDTVAIRMPQHPLALKLIELARTPIAAPSANPFGYLSPTTAQHVRDQLGNKVELIIDGGPTTIGLESTIIELTDDTATLLRPGGLSLEEIENTIGPINKKTTSSDPHAPGQLKYHYSPHTPIRIGLDQKISRDKKTGLLVLSKAPQNINYDVLEILSPAGDLCEAAANLFAALHRLDQADLDIIIAEAIPEIGLGRAIMNRLYKAAGQITKDQ